MSNKLVLVGNGFDLAHGLKTSYKDFLDWYICDSFQNFCKDKNYKDTLIEIVSKYSGHYSKWDRIPNTFEEVVNLISLNDLQSIKYNSNFFKRLLDSYSAGNWVDVERYYFRFLKSYFSNSNSDTKKAVFSLNQSFDFLIAKLSDYIKVVNAQIPSIPELKMSPSRCALSKVFENDSSNNQLKFLNFNYTETLLQSITHHHKR